MVLRWLACVRELQGSVELVAGLKTHHFCPARQMGLCVCNGSQQLGRGQNPRPRGASSSTDPLPDMLRISAKRRLVRWRRPPAVNQERSRSRLGDAPGQASRTSPPEPPPLGDRRWRRTWRSTAHSPEATSRHMTTEPPDHPASTPSSRRALCERGKRPCPGYVSNNRGVSVLVPAWE